MPVADLAEAYVRANIGTFHRKRLESLQSIDLHRILARKNPYLFRAKNILTAQKLVSGFLNAHLSSQEETLFGNFLEGLAIHLNEDVYGGWKSTAEGIDLEFDKERVRQIVSIKSGPNWGNSNQIKKMRDNFARAERAIRTGNSRISLRSVNGCCYGRDNSPEKDGYTKLCGQRFWQFVTGDALIYKELIEPLGHEAKSHNDRFNRARAKISNQLTGAFIRDYCREDGAIDWQRLIEFNSAADAEPE